jgi:hypothetical protein
MSNDHVHPVFASLLDDLAGAKKPYRMPPGVCAYCDEHRDDGMMPPHTPSSRCESGKRPHCTCDVCF